MIITFSILNPFEFWPFGGGTHTLEAIISQNQSDSADILTQNTQVPFYGKLQWSCCFLI